MTEHSLRLPGAKLHHVLSATHEPQLVVDPGDTITVETELALGDVIHTLDDVFDPSLVNADGRGNPATGPIAIRGATPQHCVICDIEDIDVIGPGVTALVPGVGPFVDWIRGRDFGVHSRIVAIEPDGIVWGEKRLPLRAMLGVIGVAPRLGAISTIDNGPHGGNLDVQEVAPGTRVMLPIQSAGGLMYFGDGHALQGDGELCGIGGIEVRTRTRVRLDLCKKPEGMVWPRIETTDSIGAIACARPLEDAFRLSIAELVKWLGSDYNLAQADAVLLLGQIAEARCTQLVNPKYTYVTKIAKRYLG